MDDLVRKALAKWPDVPDCLGWLALDARGRWRVGDGVEAPRQAVTNQAMNQYIARNYLSADGYWIFQNGPQRVFVELAYTPFVWRLSPLEDGVWDLVAQTGTRALPVSAWLDEAGRFVVEATDAAGTRMVGVVHDHDTALMAELLCDEDGGRIDDGVLMALLDGTTLPMPLVHWARSAGLDPIDLPLERIDSALVPAHFGFEPNPSVTMKVDVDTRR